MVDLITINRRKMNTNQPTNQPYRRAPNTNLLIFGYFSQRPQKYQQSIRLTAATLGVSLASA
jgi:hypothetical protein